MPEEKEEKVSISCGLSMCSWVSTQCCYFLCEIRWLLNGKEKKIEECLQEIKNLLQRVGNELCCWVVLRPIVLKNIVNFMAPI